MLQHVSAELNICRLYCISLLLHEMKFTTSSEVRPYSLVEKCQHGGGTRCHHRQDTKWRQQVPLKSWNLSAKLHGFRFRKYIILYIISCRSCLSFWMSQPIKTITSHSELRSIAKVARVQHQADCCCSLRCCLHCNRTGVGCVNWCRVTTGEDCAGLTDLSVT